MEEELRTIKIRTKKGKILTLHDIKQQESTISGIDKFGAFVVIAIDDIAESLPETRGEDGN